MIDRVVSGFHPFVLPFLFGMAFVLLYCLYGLVRIILQLSAEDRRKFFVSLITPTTILKNLKDIFLNCLLHVKLWKRNKLLGYMHSSIAFGWFMLILLGHVEVLLFVPGRINLFYYPIFFNYFVAEGNNTVHGALLFTLMDIFLLMVLSGIVLAVIKRVHSHLFGMRRTTRPSVLDIVGLYSLWLIFPLRLLAEGFTAHISGGGFLITSLNWVFRQFWGDHLNMLPTWWAYSISLCIFMCVLPFTRYMHIPAEMLLIPMRNAGLTIKHARKGFAKVMVYSCPNCGVCIDACPMSVERENLKDTTVYLTRQIRRGNEKRIEEIADKCLLCGKCTALCQVGMDGPRVRIAQRAHRKYSFSQDFSNINLAPLKENIWRESAPLPQIDPAVLQERNSIEELGLETGHRILYFSGCMTQLTPTISKAVTSVLDKTGLNWQWLDKDGGLCCGRPMLMAGRIKQAGQLIRKNEELIKASGCNVLLLSCPICYKIFKEHYKLSGIRVVHHSEYFYELMRDALLKVEKGDIRYVFHDPCELGRGSGIYDQPRKILGRAGYLVEAEKNRVESICCGGSLGSLSLSFKQREAITRNAIENLVTGRPDAIATACPLCKSTLARYSDRPVRDIAEILDKNS